MINRWWVVFGSFIGQMVNTGVIVLFTFGVFLKPISADLGWGRATLTSAMFLAGVIAAFVAPVVGKLMDVYGVRRVALPGIVIYSITIACFSLLGHSLYLLYALAAIAAFSGHVQTPMGYAKIISSRFEQHRGIALGIAIAGVGAGTAIIPQIAQLLIHDVGWRLAFVGVGIIIFVLAFPAVAICLREPGTSNSDRRSRLEAMAGPPLSEVMHDRRFWLLLFTFFLSAIAINGTITHIVALLTDRGNSAQIATSVLSSAGIALIVGRLISGYCLDRVFGPYVAIGFFLTAGAGIALIASGAGGLPAAWLGTVMCGLGLGAEGDLLAYFVGRYFGLRSYGTVYGFMIGVFSLGNGVGPFLMGLSFDRTHSYWTASVGFIALTLTCCILALFLGAYSFSERTPALQPGR